MNFASTAPSAPDVSAVSRAPNRGWQNSLQAGAAIWALSLFVASPPFSSWSWTNLNTTRAADFLRQCANPMTRNLVEPILAYRISTPLLAWLLHLPAIASLALPYLFSLGALVVIHRAMSLRTEPRLASAMTIATACSSTFRYSHGCLGLADSLTHLGSAVALIGNAPTAAVAVLVSCCNDERSVLALPFIALWRCQKSEPLEWRSSRSWLALGTATLPLVTGLVVALGIRHALSAGWIGSGISTPPVYHAMEETVREFRPWLGSWGVWLANLLNGPGWLWLFILPPCFSSRWRPGPFPAVILGTAFALVCASTLIVADVARSIGFSFPAALLGCIWMCDREPKTTSRLAVLVGALQLATPALWIYQHWQWLQFRPFPWEFWLLIHRFHG